MFPGSGAQREQRGKVGVLWAGAAEKFRTRFYTFWLAALLRCARASPASWWLMGVRGSERTRRRPLFASGRHPRALASDVALE